MLLSKIKLYIGGDPEEAIILHGGEHIESLAKMKCTGDWLKLPNICWFGEMEWGTLMDLLKNPHLIP